MSFRASHYFVSFMSEASVIAAGFGAHSMGSHILWHYTVTQPHNVEVILYYCILHHIVN